MVSSSSSVVVAVLVLVLIWDRGQDTELSVHTTSSLFGDLSFVCVRVRRGGERKGAGGQGG